MLEIQDYDVMGFRMAINGMRNAMNSWDKSDSYVVNDVFIIGEDDMKLCKRLIKAGSSDRKFLRMIHVQFDIKASETFWMQMDTYKVGTVSNSTSKMHTIHKRDLYLYDFSHDNTPIEELQPIVDRLNELRNNYMMSKNKAYWNALIEQLPMSFMQMRTMDMNYETLMSIYFQRRNHKLDDWHTFCNWIIKLPYMEEFISVLDKKDIEARKNIDGVKKDDSNAMPYTEVSNDYGEKTIIYEYDPDEPTIDKEQCATREEGSNDE